MTTSRVIPLDQAMPGMVLADAIREADGNVLLHAGASLGEAQLAGLLRRGIRGIAVVVSPAAEPGNAPAVPTAPATPQDDAVRAQVRRLFRKSETDATTHALFKAVLEYRLERIK
jgi:hypothetical protein